MTGTNAFSKEELLLWEEVCEGFSDDQVLSEIIGIQKFNGTDSERTNDQFWLPQPYIAQSFSGTDMTSNFVGNTQLSVPASIGYKRSSPWVMTADQLRDAIQEQNLGEAARQKLASDINLAVSDLMALTGSIVVKRTAAASGFDDVSAASNAMTRQGVNSKNRMLALSHGDYNLMASNLAARQDMTGKPTRAYEEAYVGNVGTFRTFQLDYSYRLTAAAGVTVTVNGSNQYYTPKATSTAATGEVSNVDNRYQNLTIAVTSGTVKVGDCFTIAGVNEVHHITKRDTGQLKTFRVASIVSGAGGSGVIQISPPIISAGGATDAEKQYQNVSATPASGAAITWLNTTAADANPFWIKDSIKLLPGTFVVPTNAGAGILTYTTTRGIQLVFQKQYDVNTMLTRFRIDTKFGLVNTNPEMNGLILFGQS